MVLDLISCDLPYRTFLNFVPLQPEMINFDRILSSIPKESSVKREIEGIGCEFVFSAGGTTYHCNRKYLYQLSSISSLKYILI